MTSEGKKGAVRKDPQKKTENEFKKIFQVTDNFILFKTVLSQRSSCVQVIFMRVNIRNARMTNSNILLFGPGLYPSLAAGGGGGAPHGQGSARLVRGRKTRAERPAGREGGDPPSEEQPWREMAGSLPNWKL